MRCNDWQARFIKEKPVRICRSEVCRRSSAAADLTGTWTRRRNFRFLSGAVEKMLGKSKAIAADLGEAGGKQTRRVRFQDDRREKVSRVSVHAQGAIRADASAPETAAREPSFIATLDAQSASPRWFLSPSCYAGFAVVSLNTRDVQRRSDEGQHFVELMSPTEAVPDENAPVNACFSKNRNTSEPANSRKRRSCRPRRSETK
jgi:hypothetical protein